MELTKIEKLLEKYDNATTTLQEEEVLQTYFKQAEVPLHLKGYKHLFCYFSENKKEQFTPNIPLKTKKTNWKWLGITAAFVIMFSVYGLRLKQEQMQTQKAQAQVEEALQLLASNLNKGNDAILQLATYEQTTNKIFQSKK